MTTLQSQEQIGTFTYDEDFISNVFLDDNFNFFLNSFATNTFGHLPAVSQFNNGRNTPVSFDGAPIFWTKNILNGMRINDVFESGNSLFIFPLQQSSLNLYSTTQTIEIERNVKKNYFDISLSTGQLGGRIPGADPITRFIYGHDNAFDRKIVPFTSRDRVNFDATIQAGIKSDSTSNHQFQNTIAAQFSNRNLTQFNYNGITDGIANQFFQIQNHFELSIKKQELHIVAKVKYDDQHFFERGFSANETAKLHQQAITFGLATTQKKYTATYGLNLNHHLISANNRSFQRNIIDQDGEGFEPWYSDGSFIQINPNTSWNVPIGKKKKASFIAQTDNQIIFHRPKNQQWNHAEFQQFDSTFTPLTVTTLNSSGQVSGLLQNYAGVFWENTISPSLHLLANTTVSLDGLFTDGTYKVSPNFNFEFALQYNIKRSFFIGFQLYRERGIYHWEHIKFLSANYLSGKEFYWNDNNGNRQYDASEKGEFIQNTGGNVHQLSSNLKQAVDYGLTVPIEGRFKNERIRIGLTGKLILHRNTWRVALSDSVETSSIAIPNSEQPIFNIEDQAELNYEVINFPKSLMQQNTGNNSFLFSQPFYASVIAHFGYESKKWYIYASFQAYMSPGVGGAIGNGPFANGIGILSESAAHPNSTIKNFGRLDADRSYIAKLMATFTPSDRFSMALQVKYIDGQPFNSFNTYLLNSAEGTQALLWNNGIKGDNPFTGEFNKRTDGIWNFDVRLNYNQPLKKGSLQYKLHLSNLFDFGMALREYTFQPAISGERSALALEVPRGMKLGVQYVF